MRTDQLRLEELRQAARKANLQEMLTTQEAADFARCSTKTLYRRVKEGALTGIKAMPTKPGRVLIPKENLLRFLAGAS